MPTKQVLENTKRIIITDIGKRDAFYPDRESYIGLTGEFKQEFSASPPGYSAGNFIPDEGRSIVLFAIRYQELIVSD